MLNTSDVKSLSKGGTTVSLEEISNSIDNKLSIDNLTGSNGIEIAKNTAGDKVEVGMSLPIVFSDASPGLGSGGTIIKGTYTSGIPGAAMIQLESPTYKTLISPVKIAMFGENAGHTYKLELASTGIGYTYDGAAYSILRQDNVKTLFGNQQSIYGSGNIDLYVHNLVITATSNNISALKVLLRFPSSSNIKIDSLADLYTACSKFGEMEASGYVTKGGKICSVYSAMCNSGDGVHFIEASGTDVSGVAWTAMTGVTIADEVTTV